MDKGVNLFFEIFKDEQESNTRDEPFCIGIIESTSPLKIRVGDLPLYEKDLLVNEYLRAWKEEVTGITAPSSCAEGSPHTHKLVYINHPSKLKVGKRVACYGIQYSESIGCYQKYVVLEVLDI